MSRSEPQPSEVIDAPVRRVGDDGSGFGDAIRQAVSALGQGGIVAIPTDTVYGLAASIRRPDALARLYTVKGRPDDRPLPVLLADSATLEMVADPPTDRLRALLARFWPGGLTVAVPAQPHIQSPLRAPDGTVGVRVPAHPVALALLRAAGGALAVTSANRSGMPPASSADEVVNALGARVDLVLDAGQAPGGAASTVVGFDQGRLVLHREGAISWSVLQRAWEEFGRSGG